MIAGGCSFATCPRQRPLCLNARGPSRMVPLFGMLALDCLVLCTGIAGVSRGFRICRLTTAPGLVHGD
jgi:hypothetical protein